MAAIFIANCTNLPIHRQISNTHFGNFQSFKMSYEPYVRFVYDYFPVYLDELQT